jgi:hypothetical protein
MAATFDRLPLDVQRMILVPDATYRASFSGAPAVTARPAITAIDALLGFHVWSRHAALVASDVRRLRFFASTDGTAGAASAVLRVSKSHPIVRNELRLPAHYWQTVPAIRHLCRRVPTTREL